MLQQLLQSLRPYDAAMAPVLDMLECMYTAKDPLPAPALLSVCALLRTLWGGAALLLQLMPRGFEGLLQHIVGLQELQHVLLHAAKPNEDPQEKLMACLAAHASGDTDLMRRSGRYLSQGCLAAASVAAFRAAVSFCGTRRAVAAAAEQQQQPSPIIAISDMQLKGTTNIFWLRCFQHGVPAVAGVYVHPDERHAGAAGRLGGSRRDGHSHGKQQQQLEVTCSDGRQQHGPAAHAAQTRGPCERFPWPS